MRDLTEQVAAAVGALPAVDQHCHTLVRDWSDLGDAGAPRWRHCFTEARRPRSLSADVPASTGYRQFLRAMGTYLGETGGTRVDLEDRVVGRRAERLAADPEAYAHRLFDDAGVSALLVDTGFGPRPLATDVLERLVGRSVRTVVRVESIAEQCLGAAGRASVTRIAFTDRLLEALEAAIADGVVGFKTIAAYRAGLDLPEPSAARVAGALRRLDRATQARRLDDRTVIAHVVWTAARLGAVHGLPLQVHVGFGDEDVHLPTADPTLLRPLFRDPTTEACPVVLLHNHPYVDQAAYLASVYPQVLVDLSLSIPLLGEAGAGRAIASALALCPVSKLLAGSDGHSYPEMHWRGMRLWREALGRVLAAEVEAGRMDVAEVEPVARSVLSANSERVYGLAGASG